MKNMSKAIAGIFLLVALGGMSQASTVYTDAALKGCYGFLSNSVGQLAPHNSSTVGTICFDGKGNILPKDPLTGEDQTGWVQNIDGAVTPYANVSGNYTVKNTPGQGTGSLTFTAAGCGTYEFTLNEIKAGVANGFQFTLLSADGCAQEAPVQGGWARIQP